MSRSSRRRGGPSRRQKALIRPSSDVLINPALEDTSAMGVRPGAARHRVLGESCAVELGQNRIVVAGLGFVVLFAVLGVRLAILAFTGAQDLSFLEARNEPDRPRGDIVDRRGQLLATDVTVYAAYADPARVWDNAETARQIASVLPDLEEEDLFKRLEQGGRFVWIARELTPRQRYEVHNLGLPGIAFKEERKRFYPHGPVAAHMLGHVTIDGLGVAGSELAFDEAIRNRTAADGPVSLAMDLRIQHIVHEELRSSLETFQAKAAVGLLLHVHTGEILAMVSLPSFDPNEAGDALDNALFNRATAGVYELGSTMKAFAVATALDTGVVTLKDGYDATKPIRVGRHTIRDFHAQRRYLTVPEIFLHSSNIGTARMVLDMEKGVQRQYLERFGLLSRLDVELPERAKPLVPQRWGELHRMTISFGHGLAISPLHLAVGGAALVNGGCRLQPTILPRARAPAPCERVISERTSAIVRNLMRSVVVDGTGGRADVDGYPVAGKTGTAEKASSGGYDRSRLLSSFLGVFPAGAPDYLVYVVLDEPKPTAETFNYATGGWTAAPTVRNIVKRAAPLLGIPPEPPTGPPEEPQAGSQADVVAPENHVGLNRRLRAAEASGSALGHREEKRVRPGVREGDHQAMAHATP